MVRGGIAPQKNLLAIPELKITIVYCLWLFRVKNDCDILILLVLLLLLGYFVGPIASLCNTAEVHDRQFMKTSQK